MKLEDLIESQDWDEAMKRIAKLKGQNRKKLDHALSLAVRDPEIPLDLFTELVKKYRKDDYDGFYRPDTLLWERMSSETWARTCRRGSTALMEIMLKELFDEDLDGRKPNAVVFYATIVFLWRVYLTQDENQEIPGGVRNGRYQYRDRSNAFQQFLSDRFARTVAKEDVQNQLLSITSMDDLEQHPELNLLWEKTLILLRCASSRIVSRDTQQQRPVLHEMVSAALPPIVVWLADRLYPSTLGTRDSQGLLPLHHAIRNEDEYDLRVGFSGELSVANGSVYKLLVSTFPEAARYLDLDGSLPLVSLLKEHKVQLGDVEALVKAEPRALITRDIKTGYYPFTTAAAREHPASYGYSNPKSEDELSLVYMLLRANPLAISSGIKENDHELYLKKKLAGAESKVTRLESKIETLVAENKEQREEIEMLRAELQSMKNEAPSLKRGAPVDPPLPDGKKARA